MTLKNTLALFGLAATLLTAKTADAQNQSQKNLAPEGSLPRNNIYFDPSIVYRYVVTDRNLSPDSLYRHPKTAIYQIIPDGHCVVSNIAFPSLQHLYADENIRNQLGKPRRDFQGYAREIVNLQSPDGQNPQKLKDLVKANCHTAGSPTAPQHPPKDLYSVMSY